MKRLNITLQAASISYLTWRGTIEVPDDLTPQQEEDILRCLHDTVDAGDFQDDDEGVWERRGGDIAPAAPDARPDYIVQAKHEWEIIPVMDALHSNQGRIRDSSVCS